MVARDGIEPPTPAFSGLASTGLTPWFNSWLMPLAAQSIVPKMNPIAPASVFAEKRLRGKGSNLHAS